MITNITNDSLDKGWLGRLAFAWMIHFKGITMLENEGLYNGVYTSWIFC